MNKSETIIYCHSCCRQTTHKRRRDTMPAPERSHIKGSERYECSKCENPIFKTKGQTMGLIFLYD